MKFRYAFMMSLFLLIAAEFVAAQTQRVSADTVYNAVSPLEISKILNEFKYKFTTIADSQDPRIELRIAEATPVVMSFYDCFGGFCSSVLLQYGVDLKKGTTSQKINDWNLNARFSRSYLDDQQDPFLESDFDLRGGVSINNIRQWIRNYRSSLADFLHVFKN